jgi:hypothetical protein
MLSVAAEGVKSWNGVMHGLSPPCLLDNIPSSKTIQTKKPEEGLSLHSAEETSSMNGNDESSEFRRLDG